MNWDIYLQVFQEPGKTFELCWPIILSEYMGVLSNLTCRKPFDLVIPHPEDSE
jgi:hypothetical protein